MRHATRAHFRQAPIATHDGGILAPDCQHQDRKRASTPKQMRGWNRHDRNQHGRVVTTDCYDVTRARDTKVVFDLRRRRIAKVNTDRWIALESEPFDLAAVLFSKVTRVGVEVGT